MSEISILRAQRAAQSGILDILAEREARLVSQMVGHYRAAPDKVSHAYLAGVAAAISELRLIASEIRRDLGG